MTCDRRLGGEPDGLVCTADGPGHTHVYVSTTVADKSDASEATDE